MFFFGIFGIGNKVKDIKEFNNCICVCGRYSHLKLFKEYSYFHFFFIPLFTWGRRYYLEDRSCGRVFEVPPDYRGELLRSSNIDFSRLQEVKMPFRVCPGCGKYSDANYQYCPYCGREL